MYEYEADVRYTEVTKGLQVPLHQIIDYFQDCSIMDSEMLGKGVLYLEQHRKGWILTAWQIEILQMPEYRQHITVRTWPYDFNGIYGYRNFQICDAQGQTMVQANSLWCMMSMDTGMPLKLTPDDTQGYELRPAIDMTPVSRKLPVYPDGERMEPFAVRKNDIDTNGHVNNARYIAYAEEYVPDAFKTEHIRVQYKRAAKYGDRIYPVVSEIEQGYGVMLCDESYKPYVVIEFLTGQNGD